MTTVTSPTTAATAPPLPNRRPPHAERTFVSELAEAQLKQSLPLIRDEALRTLFSNCWLNTLDTTIFSHHADHHELDHAKAQPRTWVITGDIAAMWLRDSTNQVSPYLSLLSNPPTTSEQAWSELYRLILGVVYVQTECILFHPFSNAFVPPSSPVRPDNSDRVHPPPPRPTPDENGHALRVWESKWELDSLCSFLDLSAKLAHSSSRADFLGDASWRRAVQLVLEICRLQQRGTDEEVELLQEQEAWKAEAGTLLDGGLQWPDDHEVRGLGYEGARGVYRFQRHTGTASETRALSGLGEPADRCGLVKSAFRPSDDATVFPFLVPSNCYLVVALTSLSDIIRSHLSRLDEATEGKSALSDTTRNELASLETVMRALAKEVNEAIVEHAMIKIQHDGQEKTVFAYEVDGYGSYLLADDANLPSLLSLPFIGYCLEYVAVYASTRSLILSPRNKWYFCGSAGSGIGGMHIGWGYIWPMSIIMRALTVDDDDQEVLDCLAMLKATTAGTGLMHESFWKDDARRYTRNWFAWTNGLFGQLILDLLERDPHLLQ